MIDPIIRYIILNLKPMKPRSPQELLPWPIRPINIGNKTIIDDQLAHFKLQKSWSKKDF
jgi:hypothetical protein